MNGREMVRRAQTNKLDSFARLDGITSSWAVMDFNQGMEAWIQEGGEGNDSNSLFHLIATPARPHTLTQTLFM